MDSGPIITLDNITKDFSGVRALDNVALSINRSEILALVGENGAGKSTLVKILAGVHPFTSYDGDVRLEDEIQEFRGPKDSQYAGISMIHQELMLIKDLSVAENIFLGRGAPQYGIINWSDLYEGAYDVLANLDASIDPRAKIRNLGISQLQLVEIAKALSQKSRILILDEPTAALTDIETQKLFGILRNLQERGVTCIYISHRLREIFELSDRIAVLRDGLLIGVEESNMLDYQKVVSMMIGRDFTELLVEREISTGPVVLEVRNYSVRHPNIHHHLKVKNVSFTLRKGEILGLAGLLGAGRTDLVVSIFGVNYGEKSGEIYIDGEQINIKTPRNAIQHGLALVTEDRQTSGIVPILSVAKNLTLAILQKISNYLVLSRRKENTQIDKYIKELKIKVSTKNAPIGSLSGGNQQKVIISRWLATDPKVLIMDEPTRGIDVETKFEIYQIMRDLSNKGMGIIMISSDLKEIMEVCGRILVMHEGVLTGEFNRQEATEELIMACATGTQGHLESNESHKGSGK
jgi:D-xylose transport system ATP-binding protein